MSGSLGLVVPRRRARVSLTPLIDVVFILLVFFMLASSFVRERAIALETATPGAEATASSPNHYLLRVGTDWYEFAGERLALDVLRDKLERIDDEAGSEPPVVSVQALENVTVQRVVAALDALDAARIDNVSLLRGSVR